MQAREGSEQEKDGTVQFNEQFEPPARMQSAMEHARGMELLLVRAWELVPLPAQLA
jgi:hypothetical protein